MPWRDSGQSWRSHTPIHTKCGKFPVEGNGRNLGAMWANTIQACWKWTDRGLQPSQLNDMSLTISGFHYMTSRNPLQPNVIISQYTGYKKPSCHDTFLRTDYNSHSRFQHVISKSFIRSKMWELLCLSKFQQPSQFPFVLKAGTRRMQFSFRKCEKPINAISLIFHFW